MTGVVSFVDLKNIFFSILFILRTSLSLKPLNSQQRIFRFEWEILCVESDAFIVTAIYGIIFSNIHAITVDVTYKIFFNIKLMDVNYLRKEYLL